MGAAFRLNATPAKARRLHRGAAGEAAHPPPSIGAVGLLRRGGLGGASALVARAAGFRFAVAVTTAAGGLGTAVPGDSLLKSIRAEFPVFASISAAVKSGINLAFDYGITLIGFVREARMNIYTHSERIITLNII